MLWTRRLVNPPFGRVDAERKRVVSNQIHPEKLCCDERHDDDIARRWRGSYFRAGFVRMTFSAHSFAAFPNVS